MSTLAVPATCNSDVKGPAAASNVQHTQQLPEVCNKEQGLLMQVEALVRRNVIPGESGVAISIWGCEQPYESYSLMRDC
jgi:hypothetical protein